MAGYLPICKEDLEKQNIDQLDFVYVIGDAYVDHPSFGPAIISRILESHGYTIGIISQPDWKDQHSISILGKPRLAFIISGGNMIPWLITIMYPKSTAQRMPIPQAVR